MTCVISFIYFRMFVSSVTLDGLFTLAPEEKPTVEPWIMSVPKSLKVTVMTRVLIFGPLEYLPMKW